MTACARDMGQIETRSGGRLCARCMGAICKPVAPRPEPPQSVIVNCRNPHGGDRYVARAVREVRAQASSTSGRRAAVAACAAKIYPAGYKLHQCTAETWIVSRQRGLNSC